MHCSWGWAWGTAAVCNKLIADIAPGLGPTPLVSAHPSQLSLRLQGRGMGPPNRGGDEHGPACDRHKLEVCAGLGAPSCMWLKFARP